MSSRIWSVPLLLALSACSATQTPIPSSSSAAYLSARTVSTPSPTPSPSPAVTVLSTGDGDTLRVQQDNKAITVRLSCIDAPEANQPQGQAATDRLRELLPRDTPVTLRIVDTDRYGRTVAEVYRDGQSINLQLVAEGQAVVYPEYFDNCAATREQYLTAESNARAQRLAFWSEENPTLPWEWRRGVGEASPLENRSSPAAVSPIPTAFPTIAPAAALPACANNGGDCDCKDFTTQQQARQVLAAFPGDPHRLDGDRDGIPCESLP
jgi:micrococcal nuclease